MKTGDSTTFRSFLSQLLLPFSMFIYVSAIILKLKDSLYDLGPQLLCISIFLVLILWTVYAWITKVPSKINNDQLYYKYNKKIRYGAFVASILAVTPIFFVINSYQIPYIMFNIENKSDSGIYLSYFNNYEIIKKGGVWSDNTIDRGLVGIYVKDNEADSLYVAPDSIQYFKAKILKKSKVRNYLKTGDCFIALDIDTKSKRYISCKNMLYLTRSALKNAVLDMEIK